MTPIWEADFACAAVPGRPATASSRAGLGCRHGHKSAPVQSPGSLAPSARGNTALSPPPSCIRNQQAERDSAGEGEHPAAPPPPRSRRRGGGPAPPAAALGGAEEKAESARLCCGLCLPCLPCLPQPLPVRPPAGPGPSGTGALPATAASSKIYI